MSYYIILYIILLYTVCELPISTWHCTVCWFCVTMSTAVYTVCPLSVSTSHSTVCWFCVTRSTAVYTVCPRCVSTSYCTVCWFCVTRSTAVSYSLFTVCQYLTKYRLLVLWHYAHCCLLESVHCLSIPYTVSSVGSVPLCPLLSSTVCPLSVTTLHCSVCWFCVTMSTAVFYSLSTVCQYLTLYGLSTACQYLTLYGLSTACQYFTLYSLSTASQYLKIYTLSTVCQYLTFYSLSSLCQYLTLYILSTVCQDLIVNRSLCLFVCLFVWE